MAEITEKTDNLFTQQFARIKTTAQQPPKQSQSPPSWAELPQDRRMFLVRCRIEIVTGKVYAEWPDAAKQMLVKLSEYMRQSQKRWLLIIGSVGVGKTTMAKALAYWVNQLTQNQEDKIMIVDAALIADLYRHDNADAIIKIWKRKKILVDDIGIESDSLKVFGNTVYPLTEIIQKKYDDPSSVLIMTTNLKSEEIAERYGERVLDRIIERCFIIKNESNSLRH